MTTVSTHSYSCDTVSILNTFISYIEEMEEMLSPMLFIINHYTHVLAFFLLIYKLCYNCVLSLCI